MPIESPLLDDLRYDRVVEELIRRIPVHAPEWTDHNDSDPGIALIQLFAYLAEQVGYRLNRIPEKNHVELLKLLGIRLAPARPARAREAFFLSDPATLLGFEIPARSRVARKGSNPPVVFETDAPLSATPSEPVVFVATKNPYLYDLLLTDEDSGAREAEPLDSQLPQKNPGPESRWHKLAWDGQKPKAVELPLAPVLLLPTPQGGEQPSYLWVGLLFNDRRDAGFLGVDVTLTVQLDDEELPDPKAVVECEPIVAPGELAPPPPDWVSYYDAAEAKTKRIPGRIVDLTDRMRRSGTVRFTVPFTLGAIPPAGFKNLREAFTPTPLDTCTEVADSLLDNITGAGPVTFNIPDFRSALTVAIDAATAATATPKPAVPHPLDPRFRDPAKVKGWLRLGPLAPSDKKLRYLGFNAVGVTHAITVTGELLGKSDGRPGQTFRLGHRNVLAETLELAIEETAGALLIPWTRVDSLDGADPFARVFDLDAEAGIITFGDGRRGRIPPLVPGAGNVVAVRYRHGGGLVGESAVGTITVSEVQNAGVAGVVNFVAAQGGADAETLEQAKLRARKELSTRTRAVTAGDFEWIALGTKTVRVARAIVVPRRRPLTGPATPAEAIPATCAPPLPSAPAGLDDTFEAPGVVTVVVVPDDPAAFEPLPTKSFLRAVCLQLDLHRLVTTEVHVAPPQYFRLCEVYARVKPRPGYSRVQLQELVLADLATYLHVLRGGDDGKGAPFGRQVHVADLIARVLRVPGVERVLDFQARFVRTKSNAVPRQGRLVLCPAPGSTDQHDHIDLGPEETTSLVAESFTLATA